MSCTKPTLLFECHVCSSGAASSLPSPNLLQILSECLSPQPGHEPGAVSYSVEWFGMGGRQSLPPSPPAQSSHEKGTSGKAFPFHFLTQFLSEQRGIPSCGARHPVQHPWERCCWIPACRGEDRPWQLQDGCFPCTFSPRIFWDISHPLEVSLSIELRNFLLSWLSHLWLWTGSSLTRGQP